MNRKKVVVRSGGSRVVSKEEQEEKKGKTRTKVKPKSKTKEGKDDVS
jgi:hypothetical protein